MIAVAFTVPGEVRGKGRPRIIRIAGQPRMKADPMTASYESLVTLFAKQAMGAAPLMDVPVCVTMLARFVPARSASRRAQAAMLAGEQPPAKKPDLDNIVKVLDALNGVVWRDDAQVVSVFARKVYAEEPGLDVVIRPYAAPAASGCECLERAA
jgi:Holliday junction resolvase RusA-like endonuclease